MLKEQFKGLMENERKYKVYGVPEKSLKDFRMGSQFEVEPDQKFRLVDDEIALPGEADKNYAEDRENMFNLME